MTKDEIEHFFGVEDHNKGDYDGRLERTSLF